LLIQENGFEFDCQPDGKIHRFGREQNEKSKDCWAVLHQAHTRKGELFFYGAYGDWSTQERYKYCSLPDKQLSAEDRKHVEDAIKRREKEIAKEQERAWEEAATRAKEILAQLSVGPTDYTNRKRAEPMFRDGNGNTVIPAKDGTGKVWTLQFIAPDGQKKFLVGGRKKGNFFTLEGDRSRIFICEGYATASSVKQATGCTTIVAFDAGNIRSVFEAIERQSPNSEIIIAGDNDESRAGHSHGLGNAIYPEAVGYDWNDVHLEQGLDAVKRALSKEPEVYVHPLGFNEDTYYYTSDNNRQIIALSAAAHTKGNFYQLQPQEWWDATFEGKQGADFNKAASTLMSRCRKVGIFNPANIRGAGIWKDKEGLVINSAFTAPKKTKYTYVMARPIPLPTEPLDDTNTLENIVQQLCWANPDHGKFLIGWMVIAPFCGALEWRPHIWLTGPRGSGKSTVLESIIHALIGPWSVYIKSNSTEAGIRQQLGQNALPVVFDEFEPMGDRTDERHKAILDLFRQASFESSGEILKGSSSGHSIQYTARFAALVSSIRVNLQNDADQSRFTVLDLKEPSEENRKNYAQFEKLFDLLTPEYAVKLFTRTYKNWHVFEQSRKAIFEAITHKYNSRFAQQYSPLLAGYYLTKQLDPVGAEVIEHFNLDKAHKSTDEKDEEQCLDHLLTSIMSVEFDSGIKHERTFHEAFQCISVVKNSDAPRYEEALLRYGIKIKENEIYIAQGTPLLKAVFKGTKWANGWSKSLARIPGAQNSQQLSMDGRNLRAVKIPLDSIINVF
jgi:putative DNA primase/helicase